MALVFQPLVKDKVMVTTDFGNASLKIKIIKHSKNGLVLCKWPTGQLAAAKREMILQFNANFVGFSRTTACF